MSMPQKVLVANRGEIAVRIVRTLRRMGIASVVVHHALDADGLAVREADEAVEITGEPAVSAYLDIGQIISACRSSGADAVHPGFGFLAENAAFATAVSEAGLTFIGPRPDAIRLMGDKITSKALAKKAGVPVLPGSEDAVDDVASALSIAGEIGYPVLLKASAGGGGKGMRIARMASECADAFQRASSEALAAFGDGRVFIERYVERPRHIEIQVLADTHGNVVHLGERECSIQRRYQKVIEEAPSPFVGEELRQLAGAKAVALARQVGYVSAGTVEMIFDQSGNFYFLEMNTRLQVEHPVTELVTGIDIVEQQVRIAAAEKLPFAQDDISLSGHAIEARVYAEDAEAGFLPATGPLKRVIFPSATGIRVDHGIVDGGVVSSAFDPMLAKIIAHGRTRTEALERLQAALGDTVILGTTTNTAYLGRVLAHPAFAEGATHTGFLDDHAADLVAPPPDEGMRRALYAAAVFASRHFDRRHDIPEPFADMGSWRP